MKSLKIFVCLMLPTSAFAGDLNIKDAFIPVAPPGAMAHAAYMEISNPGETAEQIIGVTAEGYAMAHLHKSEVVNDVATMSMVDLIEIAPGQSVALEQGGLHIMLMRPSGPVSEGDTVTLTLELSDGSSQSIEASVKPMMMKEMPHAHDDNES
ncbi:MAG: copper chaperone PCu(A)C [Pseudomonadota bacterium]